MHISQTRAPQLAKDQQHFDRTIPLGKASCLIYTDH